MSNIFETRINGAGGTPQDAAWEYDSTVEENVNNVSMRLEAGDTLEVDFSSPGGFTLVIESFKLTRISDEMPP